MSSHAIKELLKKDPKLRDFWFATVAKAPSDISDTLSVVVPDFDPQFIWKGCRWQSRDAVTLPIVGNECLVVLDNRNRPWVPVWWPFA